MPFFELIQDIKSIKSALSGAPRGVDIEIGANPILVIFHSPGSDEDGSSCKV